MSKPTQWNTAQVPLRRFFFASVRCEDIRLLARAIGPNQKLGQMEYNRDAV